MKTLNEYPNRLCYLEALASEYGIAEEVVVAIADQLGPREDEGELINWLNGYYPETNLWIPETD